MMMAVRKQGQGIRHQRERQRIEDGGEGKGCWGRCLGGRW